MYIYIYIYIYILYTVIYTVMILIISMYLYKFLKPLLEIKPVSCCYDSACVFHSIGRTIYSTLFPHISIFILKLYLF